MPMQARLKSGWLMRCPSDLNRRIPNNSEVVQGRILQSKIAADPCAELLSKQIMLAIDFRKKFFTAYIQL